MMMQILEAAGLELYVDGSRLADSDNPKGYFEIEATKRLPEDASFLTEAIGKVVKVVAPLLHFIPEEFGGRVIFIERNMQEILASQDVMMSRTKSVEISAMESRALGRAFQKRVDDAKAWLEDSGRFQILTVAHSFVVDSPDEASAKVFDFLEETGALAAVSSPEDERRARLSRMADVVDASLYRQRSR